jgi:hypothetical protein
VVAGIEWRGDANSSAFDDADPETDGVAGHHSNARADGFAHDRAGMIRTGIAIIGVGATGEQQTECQRDKSDEDEVERLHSHCVFLVLKQL